MKKIKKILAFVLSTSMLLGGMNIQAFAGEQKETNTANTELDNQNEYVVPLTFMDLLENCLRRSLIRVQFRITWIMLH